MVNILYISCLVLMLYAGMFEAIVELLKWHYHKSIFKNCKQRFWNPDLSWENKYDLSDINYLKPKFLLSTSLFVFITDAYHLFRSLTKVFQYIAFILVLIAFKNYLTFSQSLLLLLLSISVKMISFHIFYTYVYKTK